MTFSMKESAIAVHEYFTSLQEAGFTEAQALYLTAEVVKATDNG